MGWRNSSIINSELQQSIKQKDNNQLLTADLMEKMLSITNGQLKTSSKNSELHEEFIVAMADYAQSFSNEDEFGNYNYINARVNQTLAGLLSGRGRHDEAVRHFSLADQFLEKSDRKDGLKNRLRYDIAMERSNRHKSKAEHDKALEYVDQALAFLDKSDSTKKALKRASALSEKCLLLSQIGQFVEARTLADSVFAIVDKVEDEMLSVNDYLSFGLINKRLLHVISQNEKTSEHEYLLPRFKQQHQYWKQLNERNPDNHWARLELAASLVSLGTISKSDPKSSLKYRDEAYESYRQLVADKPADPTANKGLIISATSLMAANLDLPGGSVERAETVFQEANVIGAKVIGKPHSVDTRVSYTDFRGKATLVAIRKADFAAAREHSSYVIDVLRNLVKVKPDHQRAKAILVENLNQYAFLEIKDESLEIANKLLDEALNLLPSTTTTNYSRSHKLLGETIIDLAMKYRANEEKENYIHNMSRGLELAGFDVNEEQFFQFLEYLEQDSKIAEALELIRKALPKLENKALAEKLILRLKQIEKKN